MHLHLSQSHYGSSAVLINACQVINLCTINHGKVEGIILNIEHTRSSIDTKNIMKLEGL